MTRFIQQQTPPMTERSFSQAPCPFCPKKAVDRQKKQDKTNKKKLQTNEYTRGNENQVP